MAISSHDIVPDSPTNTFATLNPLLLREGTLSDGNLKLSGGNNDTGSFGTILIQRTGKWYVEVRTNDTIDFHLINVVPTSNYVANVEGSADGLFIASYGSSINILTNTASVSLGSVSETATTSGNVLGYLIDVENGRVTITKNGVHKLTVTNWTSLDEEHFIGYNVTTTWPACNKTFNFGNDPTFGGLETTASSITDQNGYGEFLYAPVDSSNNPITDFKSLCTANLPDPDIDPAVDDLPEKYFKAVDYIGDGNSSKSITGVGFQPDLVWIKNRSVIVSHAIVDSVRGAPNQLGSDLTNAQNSNGNDYPTYGGISTLSSDGFTVTSGSNATYKATNGSTYDYIAWCFRAGGAPDLTSSPTKPFAKNNVQYETLSAAGITAGTITPTAMSVNTKAGFSIVRYTGNGQKTATVPHGLSGNLDFIITKDINAGADFWHVDHISLPSNANVFPNNNWAAYQNASDGWIMGTKQDDVIAFGSTTTNVNAVNENNIDVICYCWKSISGYSAFGSYEGDGSADGPFVYTGFKPAWVMIKSSTYATTTYTSWAIYDNARETYNPNNNVLYANKSINEGYRGDASTAATNIDVDFLSNGFKVRSDKAEINQATETYIYAAFAEQPFKYANAR